MMKKPDILQYDNYRLFLRDWYQWMKENREGFSFRAFSMWAGFNSPNHLQLIINGKRNITKDTLSIFLKLLKLKKKEQKYFELLVNFNQTANPESKARYLLEIADHTKKLGGLLKHNQYEYLTKWYYPVIREMVTLTDFKEDRHHIASRVGRSVTPRQVDEAIEKLLSLGLLERDSTGRLRQNNAIISTGDETRETAAYFYHDQMLNAAIEALHKKAANERNMSGITFACTKEDLPELVQMINDFRRQMLSYLDSKTGDGRNNDDVYQFSVQLFKITTQRRHV